MDKNCSSSGSGGRSTSRGNSCFRKKFLFKESHAENRSSLSLDDLAFIAAKNARGESFEHPLKECSRELLCDSIHNMVYKLALEYTSTCKEEVDDLAQDCMKRIMERIGDFNPQLGKFTTWSWRVCISVLNRVYRRESSRNRHLVLINLSEMKGKYEPRIEMDSFPMLRQDMAEAMVDLVKKYPEKKSFIEEMFQSTMREGFTSTRVTLLNAAKKAGISYFTACDFFENSVRRFFQRRFCAV